MTLEQLENEINALKSQMNVEQNKLNELEYELYLLKQQRTLQTPPVPSPPPMPYKTPMSSKASHKPSFTPPPPQVNSKSFDIEKFIGKSWMGIMASVLIFISIIMFAVVLLPFMSDTVKMCIMYAVSIVFIVGGLVLHRKCGNLYYMILSACGMGALYISMLLSNIYFKAIGDIPLYLFILIWAAGIAIVAKNSIRTFNIIGNIGIVFSVFLGTQKCIADEDVIKFIVLLLFFIVSEIVYSVLNQKFLVSNSISNIAGIIVCTVGYVCIDISNLFIVFILLATCAVQLVYLSLRKIRPYFIFNTIYKWLIYLLFSFYIFSGICGDAVVFDMKLGTFIFEIVIYVLSFISILLVNLYYMKFAPVDKFYSKLLIEVIDIITITCIIMTADFPGYIFILLVPLVFMAIGILRKDEKYLIAATAALAISIFKNNMAVIGILILVCSGLLIAYYQRIKSRSSDIIRACNSIIIRITVVQLLLRFFDYVNSKEDICGTIIIFAIVIIDMLFKYRLSNGRQDKAVVYTTYASNVVCGIVIMVMLTEQEGITYYLTLLIGCVVFMNNVERFIKSNQMWKQLYAMIKITLYIIFVFETLQSATILLSVFLFVAAIIWVSIGFEINAKNVRLYGLVTAILSIAKLFLLDLQYNSSLTRAIGFFVCGILAFLISFIYNQFEKKDNI